MHHEVTADLAVKVATAVLVVKATADPAAKVATVPAVRTANNNRSLS